MDNTAEWKSFGWSLARLGCVDAELLDAERSRTKRMKLLVGFPSIIGELAFCFVGGKVSIASITVFIIILCRCAS